MTAMFDVKPRSSSDGFPGYSEYAPLDLGNLTDDAVAGLRSRLINGTTGDFAEALARVGNCVHPIRLTGTSTTYDATALVRKVGTFTHRDTPLGVLYIPCGNRRADVCPSCSRTYARDTFELVRAGLLGGKTVPTSVAHAPLVFATLTAPGFGHVHGLRRKKDGTPTRCRPGDTARRCRHGRPLGCNRVHGEEDALLGQPLCGDCYDWTTAVVWQWHAPELWRRFTIALRRRIAKALTGHASTSIAGRASVQFAKVAEYQRRGAIHFHALIRLDGPDGPGSPAPLGVDVLENLVTESIEAVAVTAEPVDVDDKARVLRFGTELDVRRVRHDLPAGHNSSKTLSSEQVAGYLAKYSTKSTGVDPASPAPHLRRLIATARRLFTRATSGCRFGCGETQASTTAPALCGDCAANPYGLLAKWAHMLAFRGHFSSKSRRYSVTLGKLRRARARFARLQADAARMGEQLDVADLEARLLADDAEETTLVVGAWTFAGVGWTNSGDKALADAAANRAREYDQWRAERRRHG